MVAIALDPGLRVLVTAGASGIGRSIADLLIENGARVHVCGVAESALEWAAAARKVQCRAGRERATDRRRRHRDP